MHAKKCPVCDGTGGWPNAITLDLKPCHGCDGKGWVSVDEALWMQWDDKGYVTHVRKGPVPPHPLDGVDDSYTYSMPIRCSNCKTTEKRNLPYGTTAQQFWAREICTKCRCPLNGNPRNPK